jgi:glycosyltransferase involved in cell wall biosynthesis
VKLPAHIAVHYLTSVVERDGGIAMNHDAGRVIELLADRVREITLLAYDAPTEIRSVEDATPYLISPKPDNVHVVSLGPKGSWRSYFARRKRIAAVVREHHERWDVLLLRLINRRAHLVWRAARWPRLVAQVGGSKLALVRGAPPERGRLKALAVSLIEERYQRKIIHDADLTFVVGEDLALRYARTSDNISILRWSGLRDADLYTHADRFEASDAKLLFVGQLHPSKGVFDVLDAFGIVKREILPDATLHIVGDGVAADDMRRRAGEGVVFHGWIGDRDELLELYRATDALFCLSHADFMPRVVWEALGSSAFVIATPVGTLPHAFTDRVELLFVPQRNPGAAAEAVRTLLQHPDLRRGMLERGRARAAEATLEKMVDGMLQRIAERWPELKDVSR